MAEIKLHDDQERTKCHSDKCSAVLNELESLCELSSLKTRIESDRRLYKTLGMVTVLILFPSLIAVLGFLTHSVEKNGDKIEKKFSELQSSQVNFMKELSIVTTKFIKEITIQTQKQDKSIVMLDEKITTLNDRLYGIMNITSTIDGRVNLLEAQVNQMRKPALKTIQRGIKK